MKIPQNNVKSKSAYVTVFIFDILAKLLMAVATVFIVRILSVEEYSVYTKFHSISSLATSVVGSGLAIAYVRYASEMVSRGRENSIGLFNICGLFIVILTIISMVLIPFLRKAYSITESIAFLSLLYGGILALNKMNQSFFQVEEKYFLSGIATNIKNVILCLVVIMLYFVSQNISHIHAIIATVISAWGAFLLGRFWIAQKNKHCNQSLDITLLKPLLAESGWLLIYMLLVTLFDQSCIFIMSRISVESDIAVYGVASKYYTLMLTFLMSITTVLRIKTSNKDMVDNSKARVDFVKRWISKVWWFAGIVCIIAISVSGFIMPLLNGNEYIGSIPVFRVLMVGVFISYIFAPNVSLMMSAKKHKLLCVLAFISFAINCCICLVAIPRIGPVGAAIAVVLSNAILNICSTLVILLEGKREKLTNSSYTKQGNLQ